MKCGIQTERRREERYPQNIDVVLQELPNCETIEPYNPKSLPGRIQNINRNGLCVVTSDPIRPLSVVRCEIPVCGSDFRIPTLMRVRWTRRQNQITGGFISGLETLL